MRALVQDRELVLFLAYVACSRQRPITRLVLLNPSAQRVLDFLNMMEVGRGNRVSTRKINGSPHYMPSTDILQARIRSCLAEAQRLEAIPSKRTAPPQTDYLEMATSLCS